MREADRHQKHAAKAARAAAGSLAKGGKAGKTGPAVKGGFTTPTAGSASPGLAGGEHPRRTRKPGPQRPAPKPRARR